MCPGMRPADGMNAVLHSDAALLQCISQTFHGMLSLRGRHAIAWDEDYLVCIGKLDRNIVEIDFTHDALLTIADRSRSGSRSKRAEQDVRDRTIHRAAHQH